ncbi:MAG: pyridoxamine 5'-phosphate oxidase family protein [Halioglobus sp.]|jgi:nitroimidazol reductase NimA-like FMN-containing flavoprotein (pyridoxamine 5'-phosphate oxidase superfamily)
MASVCKGPWSPGQIEAFLREAVYPMRLACVGADGYPRVVSVWFRYEQGTLYCVSHRESSLVALLRKNNRVGFEIAPNEPPYHGVRGQGRATLRALGDDETLKVLLQRFLGGVDSKLARWLLSRSDEEELISIEPGRWFSWDYRQRMGDTGAQDSAG